MHKVLTGVRCMHWPGMINLPWAQALSAFTLLKMTLPMRLPIRSMGCIIGAVGVRVHLGGL